MASDEIVLEYGVLNITCQPHPDGIYRAMLEKVSGTHTNFRGEDYAALSKPEREEGGFYSGQIYIWTYLDPNAPAINTRKLEEVSLEEANIFLPPDFGINGKTFNFVLRERDHRIFFETKNDIGNTLAPATFQNILDRLFAPTNLDGQLEVTISVQHDLDVIDKILNMPVLKVIEIHVVPPNPDDNDAETERVLKRLDKLNAKAKTTKLEKKAGRSTLKLSAEELEEARVAGSGNGYVKAKGLDNKKKSQHLSTADYPFKVIKRYRLLDAFSLIAATLKVAKETVVGKKR
jgi:uncharacterized protein DUF4747